MKVFINLFLNANNKDRVKILKQLRKISNPVSFLLADLIEKVTRWGLGCKRKLDISTHRNPCMFELIISETDSYYLLMKAVLVPRKYRPQKLLLKRH